MRNFYLSLVLMFFLVNTSKGQLTTTQTLTPQQLVQSVLLGGGVTATNITYTGHASAIAQYTASASTNIGLSLGVVMSSGKAFGANSISGTVGQTASTAHGLPGDADLNAIIPNTEDACILEFDFIPQGDTLTFRYVFGSDEYPNYVCSSWADVFGYLVSGPNPAGGTYNKINIATIPGTTLPVSINSINSGTPGFSYPASGCLSTSYNYLFINNQSPANSFIRYNGMSVILRAKLPVICGQTYHIKMGIADVSDGTLDSGVFLEAGSFSSLPPLNLNTTNANSNIPDSVLVEDCNTNCINFIRNGNISVADSFNLQISGNAVLGVDYVQAGNPGFAWPNKIVFAPNQDTIKICNLTALQDNITEGIDTIRFSMWSFVTSTISCLSSNAINFNLYIKDYTPVSIGQNNVNLCIGSSVTLNASAAGGYPMYTYTISSPSVNTPTINTGPVTTQMIYTITVNDVCNKPAIKQITVTPVALPTVVATNTTSCGTGSVSVSASGASSYTWSTGAISDTLIINPSSTTNYTVIGASASCTNSAIATVTVINQPISITGSNIICLGQTSTLTASGGTAYVWSSGETTPTIAVTPTTTATYTVSSVISSCTNSAVYSVSVTSNPTLTFTGPIICPGQNAIITVSGATTYTWSTGDVSNSIAVNPLISTNYSVTGTLNSACTNTAAYSLTVVPTPTIITTNTIICSGGTATLSASGANIFNWSNGVTSNSITVSPATTTNYTVVGSVGSCTSMAIANVNVINQSISILGNNNLCDGQTTILTANGGSSYSWSNGATTATISLTPSNTSTYSVNSTSLGCTNGTVITVSVSPNPTVMVTGTSICPGQNGLITASGATTYTWSTGASTSSIAVNSNINTTYTVIGTSFPACADTAIYTVNLITSQPVIETVNPVLICLDSIKTIPILVSDGNPPYQIDWLIPLNGITPYDTLNNVYYFLENRTPSMVQYTVVATDQCSFRDTIVVSIEIIDCEIIIPNVITANGDGVNDYFRINGLENFSGTVLTVFNRWGNKIYNSNDYKNDWSPDGNSGTYFYILNLTDGRKFNGFFQLFKD